jgi:hypothetical protein
VPFEITIPEVVAVVVVVVVVVVVAVDEELVFEVAVNDDSDFA